MRKAHEILHIFCLIFILSSIRVGNGITTTTTTSKPMRSMSHLKQIEPIKPLEALKPLPVVRISSGKLKPRVDYLKLSIVWQPGVNFYTKSPSRSVFSIHGLWPSRFGGRTPTGCITDEQFDLRELRNLIEILNIVWPSTKYNRLTNELLWESQWNLHGTCTTHLQYFGTSKAYFKRAIVFFSRLRLNQKLFSHSSTSGVRPSNEKPIIKRAFLDLVAPKDEQTNRTFIIELRCVQEHYLKEIRFCFSLEDNNKFIDCPRDGNCQAEHIYLVEPIELVKAKVPFKRFTWSNFKDRLNSESI